MLSVPEIKVRLIGGCRNAADQARLADLMSLAETMGLQRCVEFHPNVSVAAMHRLLAKSIVGLHTMEDEHFGISVVDYMAAGCIAVAHDSGTSPLTVCSRG
jgi:alpha-1,2-mannosyltransferase